MPLRVHASDWVNRKWVCLLYIVRYRASSSRTTSRLRAAHVKDLAGELSTEMRFLCTMAFFSSTFCQRSESILSGSVSETTVPLDQDFVLEFAEFRPLFRRKTGQCGEQFFGCYIRHWCISRQRSRSPMSLLFPCHDMVSWPALRKLCKVQDILCCSSAVQPVPYNQEARQANTCPHKGQRLCSRPASLLGAKCTMDTQCLC